MNEGAAAGSGLAQFENQRYLNLETYRQSGEGVKTPLWFVLDGGTLYIRTGGDSWKVKRMRANPQVSVVPSDSRGNPAGSWVPAAAELVADQARTQQVIAQLNNKYGVQGRLFDLFGRVRGGQLATWAIRVNERGAGDPQ